MFVHISVTVGICFISPVMLKDRSPLSNSTTKKTPGDPRLALLGVKDTHDDAYAARASEKTAERMETNQAGRPDVEISFRPYD